MIYRKMICRLLAYWLCWVKSTVRMEQAEDPLQSKRDVPTILFSSIVAVVGTRFIASNLLMLLLPNPCTRPVFLLFHHGSCHAFLYLHILYHFL